MTESDDEKSRKADGSLYHAPNLPAPFPQMPGQQDRSMPGGAGGKGIVIIRYKFQ